MKNHETPVEASLGRLRIDDLAGMDRQGKRLQISAEPKEHLELLVLDYVDELQRVNMERTDIEAKLAEAQKAAKRKQPKPVDAAERDELKRRLQLAEGRLDLCLDVIGRLIRIEDERYQ